MATHITAYDLANREGTTVDDLCVEAMSDGPCYALCSEGCLVETDGVCQHGNPSILLEMGMI